MTEFNESRWANPEFVQQYRDNADIYIVERQKMFDIMKSFFRHFISPGGRTNVLDLGCGDGIVTGQLFMIDNDISATLVDGSEEMLVKARERLRGSGNVVYIRSGFRDLHENNLINGVFDFIVSSFAIHHLDLHGKRDLFELVRSHLKNGGHFMNIDVVLAPSETLDRWYMKLWEQWMDDKRAALGMEDEPSWDVIRRYKDGEENRPDTLEDQLNALNDIGFKDIDCYYKYGIFAVYGGKKQRPLRKFRVLCIKDIFC